MNSRKIFVGGLETTTAETSMKQYFEQFGDIQEIVIMQDKDGKSRGFGFCIFKETSSLDSLFAI
jgi:RNA recognition motif-containing protein